MPIEQRFWSKVDASSGVDGCWLWLAGLSDDDYGRFSIDRSRRPYAHRFAYESLVGPVPEGLELDHLCRVRRCVNPGHLEPVDHRTNVERGHTSGALHYRARLTDDDVAVIRITYAGGGVSQYQLARQFGVSQSCVHKLVNRLNRAA